MSNDLEATSSEVPADSEDDWDFPMGGEDPDHPCPSCGGIPLGPGDGSYRSCQVCGYTWMVRWSPGVDGSTWHFWKAGERLRQTEANALLANFEAGTNPGQRAFREYLNRLLADLSPVPSGPLALVMDVVKPPGTDIMRGFDLENYLTPVAFLLRAGQVVYASATKRIGEGLSTISLAKAVPAGSEPGDAWHSVSAVTSGSPSNREWKERLRQTLLDQGVEELLDAEEVDLQVVWRGRQVGRNWVNLWKTTGDALGPILGAPNVEQPNNVNDDRIVNLAFHWNPIDTPSWDLGLGVWWRPHTARLAGKEG